MPSDDISIMQEALLEARKGLGLTHPNPPVGAVLCQGAEIIGRGWHRQAGRPHAEIEAIRSVSSSHQLVGSTLFVTLEPCSTSGKTPPCVDAIIEAGIARVVIACLDPNPAHAGAAVDLLQSAGIEVTTHVCEEEALHLIRFFSKYITTGLPYLIAKSAITLDGRTSLPSEMGQWISCKESREDVHQLRSQIDAILVGGETARYDNPRLTIRGDAGTTRDVQPLRVVLTSDPQSIPQSHHLRSDEQAKQTKWFEGRSLRAALETLGREGITSVLLESGGKLFSHALENELIDEVILYIAPILGGGDSRIVSIDQHVSRFIDPKITHLGRDIRISGRLQRADPDSPN